MRLIGFDIETKGDHDGYGLQPNRVLQGEARITSAAFVDEKGSQLFGKLEPTVEELSGMLWIVSKMRDAYLIGWNTQFDVSWLCAVGLEKEVRACRWLDGEVLRRAIENDISDKKYGLKPTVALYLPQYAGYEEEVGGNFDEINETLLKYNIADAARTAELGRIFIDKLQGEKRLTLSALICKSIVPVAKSWVKGIALDPDAIDLWERKATVERDAHFKSFMKHSALPDEDADEAKKMMTSHVKLKKYLCAVGYDVPKTDQTELSKYADVPLIKSISDWKKQNTAITKFIRSMRDSIAYNGENCTHPACRLWNTYTGRFGYTSKCLKKYQTGIAIHQIPRKTEARNCIVAPKGMFLAELDFATQESRLICDWSGDPVMQDIFDSGKDIHSSMAARIVGIDYEDMLDRLDQKNEDAKEKRYLAKIVNLSCQYRTGWKKLIDIGRTQYDVIFDEREARYLHAMYREVYRGIPIYWDTAITLAKQLGYTETRGGRRVGLNAWDRGNLWQSESTAINFPIQGTAADMKFLGIALTDDHAYNAGGYYVLDLHDAAFFYLPDTSAGYDCAVKMRDIMSDLPYEQVFGWKPRVKLPVDLKIGGAWGSLKEVK